MTQYVEPWENLADKDLVNFFRKWTWIEKPIGQTVVDFTRTNFLSPWAVTLFATYILWLRRIARRDVKIKINTRSVSGGYLVRSGFCDLLGFAYEKEVVDAHIVERTTKLKLISTSSEIPSFAKEVMSLLAIEDEEIEGALKYAIVELLRNVVQHSQSTLGGVCMGQYYPETGLVELVVADFGVGIMKTLHSNYPEIDDDIKAIKFAPQPHISGTFAAAAYSSMHENAGLGLFFIKEIVTLSGGGFFLGSGKALVNIWGGLSGSQRKNYFQSKNKCGWPGTFAVIQLKRDSICEFEAVLRRCRELAAKARSHPEEFAIDFIEEVPDVEGIEVIRVSDFEEDVEKASEIRTNLMLPALSAGRIVVLDFKNVKFATQSFIHALVYKILRDSSDAKTGLSIANCTESTREALLSVAAYATMESKD